MHDGPVTEGNLTLRRLRDDPDDLGRLTRWRGVAHVHAWWDPDEPPPTLEQVARKYAPRTLPDSPTTSCVIELAGEPIGYIQYYRWSSYADEAAAMDISFDDGSFGLDVFVGEPDGLGNGARAIDLLCRHLETSHGATRIALLTDIENVRAQRAYEKAGFVKVRETLDLDTRDGHRARSWLMRRDAP